jgi:O-antigen/teichoic acid export membrane protein
VLVGAIASAFTDIVTMIAGLFLPPDDVATVGVTIRLAGLAGFITQATQQFILPDLTDAMARGTSADVNRLLLRINMVALGAIVTCIGGAMLLGPFVLGIYGQAYVAGHWPLVLFLVGLAFRAASGMNQHLLSLSGHQINTAGACIVALLFLIGVTSLLAPVWGIMGLAIAVVLAEVVWATMLASQARELAGRRGDLWAVLRASRA